jgi:hypothetical protein
VDDVEVDAVAVHATTAHREHPPVIQQPRHGRPDRNRKMVRSKNQKKTRRFPVILWKIDAMMCIIPPL